MLEWLNQENQTSGSCNTQRATESDTETGFEKLQENIIC